MPITQFRQLKSIDLAALAEMPLPERRMPTKRTLATLARLPRYLMRRPCAVVASHCLSRSIGCHGNGP